MKVKISNKISKNIGKFIWHFFCIIIFIVKKHHLEYTESKEIKEKQWLFTDVIRGFKH
jgi:uncharacterized protein with PQ loop repeat